MARNYESYRTHHQSRRLPGFDYTQPSAYFLTICTYDRACLFGEVVEGQMHLNAYGHIIEEEWRRSEDLRAEIVLDAHVVMPNHVHGIILVVPPGMDPEAARDPRGYNLAVATQRAASLPKDRGGRVNVRPQSVGAFARAFKSAATRRINALRGTGGGKIWQPRYYDRILRDEREWHAVRQYIEQNPARWEEDKNNPMSR